MPDATSVYLNKIPRSLAQAQADIASKDWAYQATHPSYDTLRGEPGSILDIALKGRTVERSPSHVADEVEKYRLAALKVARGIGDAELVAALEAEGAKIQQAAE